MTNMEQRVWKYMLANRKATATEVALNTDAPEEFVRECMNRVSSENWREDVSAPEGLKFDADKARYDLIPPEIEEAIAKVLTFGAAKYGSRNWELGMKWGRAYAALRRHMAAWWSGEDNDPETGMPHTWHASCCLAFIVAFEARGIGTDDRHKLEVKSDARMAPEEGPGPEVPLSGAYTEHDPVSQGVQGEGGALCGGAPQAGRNTCATRDGVQGPAPDQVSLRMARAVQAVRSANGSGFVPVDL